MSNSTIETPILLFKQDGYQILTQVNVGWAGWCTWLLVHNDPLMGLRVVAKGWRLSYGKARRDAYNAYVTHSDWTKRQRGAR